MHSTIIKSMCGKLAALAAAICVAAALPSWAEAKSSTLACSGYMGTTTLTNFQALVKLSEGAYGFSYSDYAAADGSDLWFEDANGTVIPHEIDTWNASGDSFVWVKIPSVVPSTDANFPTAITMHWGEARTASQTCTATDTWSDFVGVWHIGKTVSGAAVTPTELDSTGNGLDAYAVGANASAIAAMTTTTGVIGDGRVNAQNNGLQVPDFRSHIADETKFTMSGWWSGTGTARFFSARGNSSANSINNYWELYGGLTSMCVAFGNGTTFQDKINNNSTPMQYKGNTSTGWTYITLVYNGTQATLYVNGARAAAFTASISNAAPTWGFKIGNINTAHGWVGNYDEVRMYDGVSSADRAMADYATMSEPGQFLKEANEIVAATWTGTANDNNLDNPQNWNCMNAQGRIVQGALPTNVTAVTFAGSSFTLQFPNGFSHDYQSISFSNCVLAADCDWRGLSAFTIDGTVNLNGHKLYVRKLDGIGTITDDVSAGELVTDGSFEDITGTIPAVGTVGYWSVFTASGAPQLRQWTVVSKGQSGIARLGSDLSYGPWVYAEKAPDGDNIVFVNQISETISQQITVPSAGKYIVSFWYTTRWDYRSSENKRDYSGARIHVKINGDSVGSVLCRECVNAVAERPFKKFCVEVELSAGQQEFAISTEVPANDVDSEVIDMVSVRPANVGELHLDSDSDVSNTSVSLAGTLKFVKEGTGAFTAAKTDQFYSGGTEVRQGTLKSAFNGNDAGKRFPFGAENGIITVSTNGSARGVFDMDGVLGSKKDYTRYRFVLNGGILQNTGSTGAHDIVAGSSQLKDVSLSADSEWYSGRNFGILDFYSGKNADQLTRLSLNGHVLKMRLETGMFCLLRNTTIAAGVGGRIDIEGDGNFFSRAGDAGVTATDLDFNATCRLVVEGALSVSNYVARYANDHNSGTAALNVYGTFKPSSHDYYYGCTLQNGSTIDFTSRTNELGRVKTLNETSAFTGGKNKIDFADGATVSIRLGNRRAPSGGQLISWASEPANVAFKRADGERQYKLLKKSDGLYFMSGFMIIVM